MTPKSLLRNKFCVSKLEDFDKSNSFHRVLSDHSYLDDTNFIKLKPNADIKKVIICSGKVYFDLIKARENLKRDDVVFVRIEQLYPFPVKQLGKQLKRYENAKFYWCQEEPMNMGAWNTARHYIDRTLDIIQVKGENVRYVGRNAAASPATGNLNKHLAEQKEILEKVISK